MREGRPSRPTGHGSGDTAAILATSVPLSLRVDEGHHGCYRTCHDYCPSTALTALHTSKANCMRTLPPPPGGFFQSDALKLSFCPTPWLIPQPRPPQTCLDREPRSSLDRLRVDQILGRHFSEIRVEDNLASAGLQCFGQFGLLLEIRGVEDYSSEGKAVLRREGPRAFDDPCGQREDSLQSAASETATCGPRLPS